MIKKENLFKGATVGVNGKSIHMDGQPNEKKQFTISEIREDVVFFVGYHAGEYYEHLEGVPLDMDLLINRGFRECRKDDAEIETTYASTHTGVIELYRFKLIKPKTVGTWQTSYAYRLHSNQVVLVPYLHDLEKLFSAISKKPLGKIARAEHEDIF